MKFLISTREKNNLVCMMSGCVNYTVCNTFSCSFGNPCRNNCTSYCGNYMNCNPRKPGNAQTGINIRERK